MAGGVQVLVELGLTCGPEEGYVASMCCVYDTRPALQTRILRISGPDTLDETNSEVPEQNPGIPKILLYLP